MILTFAMFAVLGAPWQTPGLEASHAERMGAVVDATRRGEWEKAAALAGQTVAVYEGFLDPRFMEITRELGQPGLDAARAAELQAELEGLQAALLEEAEEGAPPADPVPVAGELERAEAQFALGLALGLHERENPGDELAERLAPVRSLRSALALAGPGELRLAATYDAALVHFHEGERWRAQLPEVQEKTGGVGLAPLPASALTPPAPAEEGEEEPPDPLEEARAYYLRAKEGFLERLRGDWRDEDTRANLELLQRRLAELDEIEKQREEQQEQDPENESEDDGEGSEESEDEGEESEGEEEQEDDSEGEETEESEEEGNPEDQEPDDQEEPEPGEEEGGEEDPDYPEPEEAPQPHETEAPPAERKLTREEVMRLLDRLAELEEEREAIEAATREARRVRVERDW